MLINIVDRINNSFLEKYNVPNAAKTFGWKNLKTDADLLFWNSNAKHCIDPKKLFINDEYQRELKPSILDICKNFEFVLFSPLLVNKSTLEVIDGQQHLAAAILLKCKLVPVWYYTGSKTTQHLAKMFVEANKNTTVIKKCDLWKARIASGEKDVVEVENALNEIGLSGTSDSNCTVVENPVAILTLATRLEMPKLKEVFHAYNILMSQPAAFSKLIMFSLADFKSHCDAHGVEFVDAVNIIKDHASIDDIKNLSIDIAHSKIDANLMVPRYGIAYRRCVVDAFVKILNKNSKIKLCELSN